MKCLLSLLDWHPYELFYSVPVGRCSESTWPSHPNLLELATKSALGSSDELYMTEHFNWVEDGSVKHIGGILNGPKAQNDGSHYAGWNETRDKKLIDECAPWFRGTSPRSLRLILKRSVVGLFAAHRAQESPQVSTPRFASWSDGLFFSFYRRTSPLES